MKSKDKTIFINTIVMYARLIITTAIGLISSRFVLQALGASDYGLYSVVGGIISMLSIINVAMHTTTRRFINVEMGKADKNMNRIFNISRLLHFGFAIFIFILAETIGMYYIYNYLNVDANKINDAIFVFQITTITAVIGIINIPYQALMQAYEKFTQIAIFDVISSIMKLLFVISLFTMRGDVLRIYAIGMSSLTLFSLAFYNIACKKQWSDIIRYRFYREKKAYKEILFFNNYVALGATAYLSRTQGSNILVNFFFGTIVNAAFAIGYQIENFCMIFVGNIGSAAAPQITSCYANNNDRAVFLTEILNKFSIYLMMLIVVPISLEMNSVLELWLKDVPEGTLLICQLTLLSALVRTMFGGMDKLVQASGKIKWFQILGSIITISCIPISVVLYKMSFPAYTTIVVFILMTIINSIVTLYLMHKILNFNSKLYIIHVLFPSIKVILALVCYAYIYLNVTKYSIFWHILGFIICFIITVSSIYCFGMNMQERKLLSRFFQNKIWKKKI